MVPEKDRDSFELYLNWAPVLLQDFNDLSAHRVPQDDIFTYLTAAETLKQWAQKEEQTLSSEELFEILETNPQSLSTLYTTVIRK